MMKRKSYSVKISEKNRIVYVVVSLFVFFSFLLAFRKVAEFVAGFFADSPKEVSRLAERIQDTAIGLMSLGLGALCLMAAVSFASLPVVGVTLAVAGLIGLVVGVINTYNGVADKGDIIIDGWGASK